jgi:hypothetical protein
MKKLITASVLLLLFSSAVGQDIATLLKLKRAASDIGLKIDITADSLLASSGYVKTPRRILEEKLNLLSAAELYISNEFESANYNVRQIRIRFPQSE